MFRSEMPWNNTTMADLLPGKIRKRGCSSSASSSSSLIQNYRFKRTILVGKKGGSTLLSSRSPASVFRRMETPKYSPLQGGGGKGKNQAPVSARKLAATLWEMNEMPSPRMKEGSDERRLQKEGRARERCAMSVHHGSLPPHLADPSHSPGSERMDRSGTGSRHRGMFTITQKLKVADRNSNASLTEAETRSQVQTPSGSNIGVKTRLKDVSSALTTSKELLKIINRMWRQEDQPLSSMSLISALHTELERARVQVNHLIKEQRSEQNEINYLINCFAEEKAAWKSKEQEIVEAAIESVAGELKVERKLRRRFESLNKKLGRELSETKASLLKSVKELESEKRTRQIMEQVCDELAGDIDVEKTEVEEGKRVSAKVREEVEKERELMQLANVLREERNQMKISDAKYQLDEKNAAVDKLRNQLECFLGPKRVKKKGFGHLNQPNSEDIATYRKGTHFGSHQNEEDDDDYNNDGEVEDGDECQEDSAESEMHSIELNMDNNNKSYMWTYGSGPGCDPRRAAIDEDIIGRKPASGKVPWRSTSLQRSQSDTVEWNIKSQGLQNCREGLVDWSRISELEKQQEERSIADETLNFKSAKSLKDQILSGSRIGFARTFASPTRQWAQPRHSQDSSNITQERALVSGKGSKSRLGYQR